MNLYIIPIEPLKERYSEWWATYMPARFAQSGFITEVINGEPLTDSVETGTVLDASSTCFYKASQLKKIAEKFHKREIAPYSNFLVADIWFPGIEMIRYMSQLYNIPVNIWGVWHAGSITINDFAEPMHDWSRHFEIGFLNMCNGVFVGSEYSRDSIINRLLIYLPGEEAKSIADRIYAFGMPLDYGNLQQYSVREKTQTIVFPHRPDPEKNPDVFIGIVNALSTFWDDFEKTEFVFCTSKKEYKSSSVLINAQLGDLKRRYPNVKVLENLEKEAYYKLLGSAKLMVSTTSEENFGYCAVEAMALGCNVLLPNRFSHPELVSNDYGLLYEDYDDLLKKIPRVTANGTTEKELKAYASPYGWTIGKWVEIIKAGSIV